MTCEILNCEDWGEGNILFFYDKAGYTTSQLLLLLFLYFKPSCRPALC